ncbi:MAG: hypothetical protein Rhims3KO_35950 [Hyphomicrobiales bacterium]
MGKEARIQLTVRRLGLDNGMDTLVRVDENLHSVSYGPKIGQ